MTDKEYFKRLHEALDSFAAKHSGKEKARAMLRSIGVLDEDGNITPPFREEPETFSRNGHKQAAPDSRLPRVWPGRS
ncbi:MAG TPA: hypothetical protein VFH95_14830 [Candidatus Kapabacteria bacterium]|nr:hypothetical protein [Candidatus Kapabacteria bacterium]